MTPITYCEEDQILANAFQALEVNAQASAYWSDKKLDAMRARIKTFYIQAQNARCCYCQRHLGSTNHRLWDVEHVAPRSRYAHFMFIPTNLAAACPDCNSRKGEQETLVNTKRKTYPTSSADFRILHPHFDEFDDHIYQQGILYLPKTEKGKRTIYVCDLMRFAQMFIDWENSARDESFEVEVEAVFNETPVISEAAVDEILAKLPVR